MGWWDDLPGEHPLIRMAAGKPPFELTPEEKAERDLRRYRTLIQSDPRSRVQSDAWALLRGDYRLAPLTYDPVSATQRTSPHDWEVLQAAFTAVRTSAEMRQIAIAIQSVGGDPIFVLTQNGLESRLQQYLVRLLSLSTA